MHWLLDVEFSDDLSRYRTGHGAKNIAIVRRFALGLVCANKCKGGVKTRRKKRRPGPQLPARNPPAQIAVNLNSMPCFACGGGQYICWPIRHSDNHSFCFFRKKGGPVMTLDGKCVLIVEDDNIMLGL
jgi:hypothetical protein